MEKEDMLITPESDSATIPNEETVSVKFNKQQLEIPLSKASTLIQKGMKFDMISNEYSRIKSLADLSNKAVGDYITELEQGRRQTRLAALCEQCGGNREIAEKLLSLEEGGTVKADKLAELREYFPEIKSLEDLPEAVKSRYELCGENLLNIYLRYLFTTKKQTERLAQKQKQTAMSSAGALAKNENKDFDAAAYQFLKGIRAR